MLSESEKELVDAATLARKQAHSPYSRFAVGAAIRTTDGRIFTGCNIENASYGLSICAERVAIFTSVAAGVREFATLCVVADADPPASPCGACRQVIWEICRDIPVLLVNLEGDQVVKSGAQLLPLPFENFWR